ncbi:MAG: ribosome silencing factor [Proteobacteria bacterium]|nr:ribosome silencing factor [Pseudomonadota bacterium]
MAAKRPSRSSSASSARPAARAARKAPAKTVAKGPAKARAKLPRKVAAGTRPATTKPAKVRAKAPPALAQVVLAALEDMKAVNVKAMDVRGITDITDMMVVASGTSDRHVKSIADRVVQRCKEAGYRPYGVEGERDGEWVLLDLNDVVLHVMLPRVREFYALEKLWEKGAARGS